MLIIVFFLPVPHGSIPELPAETCQEIKMSEGGQAVSGKYWFHSIVPKRTVVAPCDMKTEGEFKCLSIFPPPRSIRGGGGFRSKPFFSCGRCELMRKNKKIKQNKIKKVDI